MSPFPKTPAWIAAQPLVVRVLGGAVIVLFLALALVAWRWRAAQAETARIQLEKTNAEARATPSRTLTPDELSAIRGIVKEEVGGATRPVVQVPQRNDGFDRALAQERLAISALTASIAALTAHATSTGDVVTVGDSVRGSFDVAKPPYTVHADVTLPKTRGRGEIDVAVQLEPARLMPRLGCGAAVNGVRPARYTVTGPPWLSIVIDSSSQDPALCNPNLSGARSAFHPTISVGPGLSLQYDPVTRSFRAAPSVNLSLNLWTCPLGLNVFRGKCS